ncbi:MAG TPA: carbohydrate ABC transporter permease [Chloroflexia bacterium]|nr:carbohydrate ABC transporter permease [Chloroflexia bacterium]
MSETVRERTIAAEKAKPEVAAMPRAERAPFAARVVPMLRYIAIVLVTLIFIFPFLWMILASFKTQTDIMNTRNIFSFNPTTVNYENVFNQYSFFRFMINSFVVALISTLFSLILGLPAAYAIARFKLNGFGLVLLAARIVPGITFLIPWYILFSQLKMVGTYEVLILSHMLVGLPFVTWVMISFFEGLPVDLEEAGMVDGLTPIGAFFRIALPLSTPGIITGSILSFIFSWNNFMFSYILAGQNTRTLPVAIFGFISYASIDWGGLMAAAVVITIPVLVITLFVQRYVISGLTAGATKG